MGEERRWSLADERELLDLLACAAKARPGELRCGSTGVGTGTHLGIEKFSLAAGLNAVRVPARGSDGIADTIANTIAGRTDCAVADPGHPAAYPRGQTPLASLRGRNR